MTFFERYGAEAILQTVRDYLTSKPGRAKQARSVGIDNVVQETMVNLLRYPPKKDVLLLNGCYWTASYTLKRMLNKRRPVKPAGLFYNLPDTNVEEDLEELWDVVRANLKPKHADAVYRFFHGESQIEIGKTSGVHQSVIHMRVKHGLRILRHGHHRDVTRVLTGE